MFKNREIRVRLAKTSDAATDSMEEQKPFMTKDEAHAIAKDMTKRIAIAVAAVMAASAVLHTVSEITINACDRPQKEED